MRIYIAIRPCYLKPRNIHSANPLDDSHDPGSVVLQNLVLLEVSGGDVLEPLEGVLGPRVLLEQVDERVHAHSLDLALQQAPARHDHCNEWPSITAIMAETQIV